MNKTKPTLFEQLQQEEQVEASRERPGLRYSSAARAAIMVLTVVAAALMYPSAARIEINDDFGAASMKGLVWVNETVRADYAFPVFKSEQQYAGEVRRARESEPLVFVRSRTSAAAAQEALVRIVSEVNARLDAGEETAGAAGPSAQLYARLRSVEAAARRRSMKAVEREAGALIAAAYRRGYANIARDRIAALPVVSIRTAATQEQIIPAVGIVDSSGLRKLAAQAAAETLTPNETAVLIEVLGGTLAPTLLYSQELTAQAQQAAEHSVARTNGVVRAGEVIIAKGERITEQALLRLQSYGNARYLLNKQNVSWMTVAGNAGSALCVYAILALYLFYIRRQMFDDALQLGGLSVAFLAAGAQALATVNIETSAPLQLAVMIPAVSMLVAILFDSRTAFCLTVTSAMLAAGVRGNDYATALTMTTAGVLAGYSVKDIQSRTQIFTSVLYILLGLLLPVAALNAVRMWEWGEVGQQALVALINSAISPLLTFGLLFLIERVFNITTNLRLQEYDNINHPLLLELNEKAPGTYQHTLTIARLAESAARAIGANALLAKTGAYFHDIGKIEKAEYFVENQLNIGNKHDRLSPRKSAAIIKDHVQEGIELARQYKLPQRIIDFIPMHHGTMLIRHFYAKALADAAESGVVVAEADYRYPGPKPRSRETAVVMLADAAEALSRLVKTEDRDDIEETLEKIFSDRLNDGQFDECDITMKDLVKIREVFARNLVGLHHQRIVYNELPAEPGEPAAEEPAE